MSTWGWQDSDSRNVLSVGAQVQDTKGRMVKRLLQKELLRKRAWRMHCLVIHPREHKNTEDGYYINSHTGQSPSNKCI